MNILFHCWEYPPRGSGIGQYIYHLSKALQRLGHFTVIVTSYGESGGPSVEKAENGVVYRCYSLQEIGGTAVSRKVLQIARKHNVNWIEGADHLGESVKLLNNTEGIPVVVKAHYNDILKQSRYGHVHYPWQKILINIACLRKWKCLTREKKSLAQAHILTAPCQRILTEMEKQHITLASKRLILPNPISNPREEFVRKESQQSTLLFVGRVDFGKGIAWLPELVEKISVEFADVVVEIAGDDSYARMIGSTKSWLIKELGELNSHVRFLGHQNRSELDRAFSRCWVLIVPSGWDTFPTVILEAMVRGVPVIASPNGGMAEMLDHTANFIAEPSSKDFYEKILEVLINKQLRKEMGESGRVKAISVYNPKLIAEHYIKEIQNMLQK